MGLTWEQRAAQAAWDYLVKDHPWVAKDEYYKKHPEKSMTYNAAIWGMRWEAERSALLVKALEAMPCECFDSGMMSRAVTCTRCRALRKYREG